MKNRMKQVEQVAAVEAVATVATVEPVEPVAVAVEAVAVAVEPVAVDAVAVAVDAVAVAVEPVAVDLKSATRRADALAHSAATEWRRGERAGAVAQLAAGRIAGEYVALATDVPLEMSREGAIQRVGGMLAAAAGAGINVNRAIAAHHSHRLLAAPDAPVLAYRYYRDAFGQLASRRVERRDGRNVDVWEIVPHVAEEALALYADVIGTGRDLAGALAGVRQLLALSSDREGRAKLLASEEQRSIADAAAAARTVAEDAAENARRRAEEVAQVAVATGADVDKAASAAADADAKQAETDAKEAKRAQLTAAVQAARLKDQSEQNEQRATSIRAKADAVGKAGAPAGAVTPAQLVRAGSVSTAKDLAVSLFSSIVANSSPEDVLLEIMAMAATHAKIADPIRRAAAAFGRAAVANVRAVAVAA